MRGSFEIPYEQVARWCDAHPDRFSGLAGADPTRGMEQLRDLERAVELGFVGVHAYPHWFSLPPDAARWYPIYAKCCELDLPFMLQVGQNLIYSRDVRLPSVARPILLDQVAIDFPELALIGIHVGTPWAEEMIAMAWKHPNVFIGIDAYAPRYLPASLVRYMDSYGSHKVPVRDGLAGRGPSPRDRGADSSCPEAGQLRTGYSPERDFGLQKTCRPPRPPAGMTVAEPLTLGRGLRAAARRHPRKTALRFGGLDISYATLIERAARAAAMLQTLWHIGPGDRVALISSNRPEFIEILIGCSDLGAAVAMLNPRVTEHETIAILADCEPKLVIADAGSSAILTHWRGPALVLGEDYEGHLARAHARFEDVAAETDPFALHYTSGTTGLPKGVPISHRSRVLSFFGMASEYGCYGPDDHFLALAPLCHGAGLAFALAPLYMGGTCTLLDRFDPEEVLTILHGQPITGAFFVPTHFNRIFDLPSSTLDQLRGHNLRSMISNAAPLLQAAKERVTEYFGENLLYECYGATEAGIVTNLRPALQLEKRNCVGTRSSRPRSSFAMGTVSRCPSARSGNSSAAHPICSTVTGGALAKPRKRSSMAG